MEKLNFGYLLKNIATTDIKRQTLPLREAHYVYEKCVREL